VRNYSFIINHALLPSKDHKTRAINPIAQNRPVSGSGGKLNLSHGGIEMRCNPQAVDLKPVNLNFMR
jgi:hypothetical protein